METTEHKRMMALVAMHTESRRDKSLSLSKPSLITGTASLMNTPGGTGQIILCRDGTWFVRD